MEVKQTPAELKNSLDVIWHPHPITPVYGREQIPVPVAKGSTVRQVLINAGIDPQQPIVVLLDDRMLTVEEWDTVCPDSGQIINVQATVMGGGGGGSNPLQIVAMIALIVVVVVLQQYELLPAIGGLSVGTSAGLYIAAGSMIISAIVAATTPSASYAASNGSQTANAASPTYSLSGGSNSSRPYQSMPVVMGTMRFFPDYGARPFSEYVGQDQYLYQVFHLGLSQLALSNWTIGTTPITSYTNYAWCYADSSGKIAAFPGNVDSIAGASLTHASGWIQRTTSENTYQIGIDIDGALYYANNSGGLDATSVQLRVQYKPVGTSTWITPSSIEIHGDGATASGGTIILTGNSQTPLRITALIQVVAGAYDVEVIRDTDDATDARLQNKTNWSVLRSYQLDNGTYTGQNRIGLKIKASDQLNGVIQQLTVTASATANYFNGTTWVSGQTSNPAHWFMDFARGRYDSNGKLLYGVGLDTSQIDTSALSAWASFCNTENLTFNAVLDGTQTAADILTMIARCGFASPTWASGKLGVVWDARNASPVAAFGMSNIIKGSFQVSYITEQLAEEIIVNYTNPDKDWAQDQVRVLVPGVTTPKRSSTVDLLGCTNKAMAGKFANYIAAQQHFRKRRIQWDTDFEGFVCQRGDVCILSHDLTQWGYSGRVVSVSGNTITLDRKVPMSGLPDHMMLKAPDGTLATYTVNPGFGELDTLTLASTPTFQSEYSLMDHMWFFSPLPTIGKRVKILSVQPASETRLTVIATDEDEEFYAAWDGEWSEPPQSTLLLASTPSVSNVSIKEYVYRGSDGNIASTVSVTFVAKNFDHANIKWRINGKPWQRLVVYNNSFKVDVDDTGTIEIEILPVGAFSQGTPVSASTYIYGQNSSQPVADVGSIIPVYNNASGGQTVLNWSAVNDYRQPNIQYEIRLGDSWSVGKVLGRTPLTQFVAQGDGMYWVAGVYQNGQTTIYSATPSAVEISGASLQNNVIATIDESADWSGTLSGAATISNGALQLAVSSSSVTGTSGSYTIPTSHIVNAGRVCPCNVTLAVGGGGQGVTDNILSIANILESADLLHDGLGVFVNIQPQIAVGNEAGIYGAWQNYLPGYYNGQYFKARVLISTNDPTITPVVTDFIFSVDVPDRVDNAQVTTATGGTNVTYSNPFNGGATGMPYPLVQLTIVNAQAGDDLFLTNQSLSGFTVQVKNGGTGVSRTVNWLAQGY